MDRFIIGLTGAFGSGTTFLVQHFFEEKLAFERCSLSTILKDKYQEENGKPYDERSTLQEFGNKLRKEDYAILAKQLDDQVISTDNTKSYIVESIRNPAEINYFRDKYPEFILIGVFADYDIRWERVREAYSHSKDKFDADEQRDKGSSEPPYGQKISDCFFESDLILSKNVHISCKQPNDAYWNMLNKIEAYLKALADPAHSNPTLKETLMAAAYTSGRRARCLKRKVGAVISDRYDRIISSGFNGVPKDLQECQSLHGKCYRDTKREDVARCISIDLTGEPTPAAVNSVVTNVKLLELCRALHGEESAILNLVGRSIDLSGSTIYVTMFPCNMCANKIVQDGIEHVIYFEPYPVEEAKNTFKEAGVTVEPFEGVTFRAFFKFYKFEP